MTRSSAGRVLRRVSHPGICEEPVGTHRRFGERLFDEPSRLEGNPPEKVAAYRHRYFGTPFHVLVQDLMRGLSSWTVGERELFAAFTSSRNQCRFCTTAHQAFAASCTSDDLVAAALTAPAAAPVRPQVAAVLTFLDTLAGTAEPITADDILAVRAAGVDDLALEEAVRISALFHVIKRVMDAAGAGPLEGRSLDLACRIVMGSETGTGGLGWRLRP